jgi:hypothetical protein
MLERCQQRSCVLIETINVLEIFPLAALADGSACISDQPTKKQVPKMVWVGEQIQVFQPIIPQIIHL